ncbi:Mitochondrial protein from FMP27 [Moritella viscosa]|uniref:Mitochondrial protein from FMP27 n=1 Tax=Moritella viscosa TaxID=80854 RepID=A0A1K9YXA8_9GAMM|nr:Mitochondrial protein from FMP27 [Moritella viscosa]SGY87780.1 Mitochondrial protein from FMP27 [Moritella viscosa]SGY87795.1 Mitochondrial protein from FMP27 [Moritella viscosa]SGY89599.1 Mitochondrial protein from FMP27 [Moritella viscosa]SGY90134.1 Mitochondrial protein from FMP27 [Moritella viscosa]
MLFEDTLQGKLKLTAMINDIAVNLDNIFIWALINRGTLIPE